MNTPYTLRAEQLRDIYSTLVMQNLSQDERLDVLLTVKSTVKVHVPLKAYPRKISCTTLMVFLCMLTQCRD